MDVFWLMALLLFAFDDLGTATPSSNTNLDATTPPPPPPPPTTTTTTTTTTTPPTTPAIACVDPGLQNVPSDVEACTFDTEMVIFYCNDFQNKWFSINDRFIIISKSNTSYTSLTCNSKGATFPKENICISIFSAPQNSEDVTPDFPKKDDLKIFKCSDGFQWLSFEKYRTSTRYITCWTEIKDICVPERPVPRNCSSVQDLGLSANGAYMVIPSGSTEDELQKIWCDLLSVGGRWTVIASATDAFTISDKNKNYDNENSVFVGIPNLVHFTTWNDTVTPVILEVDVKKVSDGTLIGTVAYSDFLVTSDGTLASVGTYHGSLGDALCRHVGRSFDSDMYWGGSTISMQVDSSALFGSNNHWGTYTNVRIIFRIRSKFHDEGLLCPPAIEWKPSWNSTQVTFYGDRSLGSNLTYKCLGEMLQEGYEYPPEERTSEGAVVCIRNETTGSLLWDREIHLPCTLSCPENFNQTMDGQYCNYFSMTAVANIMDASHRCMELNTSLHWPTKSTYLEHAVWNIRYFTALDMRTEEDLTAQMKLMVEYPNTSITIQKNLCTMASPYSTLISENCFEKLFPANYICTKPEICPDGFVLPETKRGCYKWVNMSGVPEQNDIFQAANECNKFASSLPAPISMNQLEDVVVLVKNAIQNNPKEGVFLGYFNNNNNWSLSGLYADISDPVIGLLGTNSLPFRVLEVHSNGSYNILPSNDIWSGYPLLNLCELHGPTGCAFSMPTLNNAYPEVPVLYYYEIKTNHNYRCSRGYFIEGNKSMTLQHITCYGQLGGWSPALRPCIRTEVCVELSFDPATGMTVQKNNDSLFLDGLITYLCPPNMTTKDKGIEQHYQCLENSTYSPVVGQPMTPMFDFKAINSSIQEFQLCDVCIGVPEEIYIKNASTTNVFKIGDLITLECKDGYRVALNTITQGVPCLDNGWDTLSIRPCYKACLQSVPIAGTNMNMGAITSDQINSTVRYECRAGFFIEPTQNYPQLSTVVIATCDSNAQWVLDRNLSEPLTCVEVAPTDPPLPGEGASYNWNNYTRTLNTIVSYTCPPESGGFSPYMKYMINLTATSTGWFPALTTQLLFCLKACIGTPTESNVKNASTSAKVVAGNNITLECMDDYMISLETNFKTVECTNNGWNPPVIDCYQACVHNPPPAGENFIMGTMTSNKITSFIPYTCEDGFFIPPSKNYPDLSTTANAICYDSGWQMDRNIPDPLICVIVIGKPPTPGQGAAYDWDGFARIVGTKVTYNCSGSTLLRYNQQNELILEATNDGWNPYVSTEMLYCFQVCDTSLSLPGENMVSDNITVFLNRVEGVVFNFTCAQETYLLPSEGYPLGATSTFATCDGSGQWVFEYPNKILDCFQMCLYDPPYPPNADSDWDNLTRVIGTNVTYTCYEDHLFGNFEDNWTITCESSQWTTVDVQLFVCSRGCYTAAPSSIGNATMPNPVTLGKEGDKAVYLCPEGTASKTGTNVVTIMCVNESWTEGVANFSCEPACPGPPPRPGANARYNFSLDYTEGIVILYECQLDWFVGGVQMFYASCTNVMWTITSVPQCMTAPPRGTPPPPANPKPIDIDDEDLHYMYTSDYSVSTFQKVGEDEKAYEDVNSNVGNHEEAFGPFGFGNAIGLLANESQCMRKTNFVPLYQTCVYNPKMCPNGLSFCIWEKPLIHRNILDSTNHSDKYNYVVSSGGDDKGHPGFAIYHEQHWLTVIVSTGEIYWKVSVLGPVRDNEWNNIGVWWKESEGLKVYINKTLTAQTFEVYQSTPTIGLSPPELIIGCHRDSSNLTYRNFFNGEIDEFVFWERALEDSKLDYFYGGFKENTSAISAELLNSYLNNLNMNDPSQSQTFGSLMEDLTKAKEESTEVTPTAGSDEEFAIGSSTNLTADSFPESVQQLRTLAKMTTDFMAPKNIPSKPAVQSLDSFLKVSKAIDNMLHESKSAEWLAIHNNRNGTPGIMQIVDTYSVYMAELVRRTTFDNDSDPFCKYNNYENIMSELCKMKLLKFKQKNSLFVKPTYDKMYTELWDHPYDKTSILTRSFFDERCEERGVSHSIVVFNSISALVNTKVYKGDPKAFYSIDSRIISFNMSVDPGFRPVQEVDTSEPLCKPDPEFLRTHPITITLEHLITIFAVRTLKFHELQNITNIEVRRCVWWNRNVGDGGEWDTTGCHVLYTTPEFTKCGCDKFGIFAIMAEKIEEKTVPPDPSWLPLVKYVLYGISAAAVIIYIIAVLISGDLKDQFHVIGFNMALCILAGSVAMVLSNLRGFNTDRHTCVTYGTLIHFFYGGLGLWTFALGHASFKAITTGVIQGRLRYYMCICWGFALMFVGIPFAGFVHEIGTDPRCFIGWNNSVKLIFFVPQIVCTFAGLFFAFVILFNLSNTAIRKGNLIADCGSFCRGAAVLLIFLSVTWLFGFFAYLRLGLKAAFANTIFQILNSLSGLCLFLFIGIGSNKFRAFITGQAGKRRQMVQEDAFGTNQDKALLTKLPDTN